MKLPFFKICAFVIVSSVLLSCERELTSYELLRSERCSSEDVIADPFIVTNFECQSNIEINDVEVIRNPSKTEINVSSFVGRYVDGESESDALAINFENGLDLSTNALFKFKVKTSIAGTLQMQAVSASSGTTIYELTINGNERWNEYEVDLIDDREKAFTQFNLIFNSGIDSSGSDIYLIDDIRFDPTIDPCEDVVTDLSIINDFDCQQNYFLGADPAQTSVEVVDNPFAEGINTSEQVGEYVDDGTDPFDNLTINFDQVIDLSQNALFRLKIYSATAGPVTVKLEGGNTPVERTKIIRTTDQWIEYSFNFTEAIGDGHDSMVLIFNAGSMDGTPTDIYYLDDLRLAEFVDPCLGVTPDLDVISDFECQQNYTLGVDPAVISVVDNIDPSGINTSDAIGEYLDDGTEPFDNLLIDFGAPIDLTDNSLFVMKVYSSRSVPLLAKLDGGTTALEVAASITEVDEWVEYSFDFSSVAAEGNDQLILFFNAGQNDGSTTDAYYIDDLRFESNPCSVVVEDCTGVAPDLSVISDFDCQQNYHLGAVPTIDDAPVVTNPSVDCTNRSSNVGEYTDNGQDPFDNLFIDLNGPFDLSTNSTLRLKILSSMVGPVLAKLEGGTPLEVFADITVTGEWTELSFDFSGATGAGNDALVLFVNAGEVNGTVTDLYYLDDIRFEAP
ncbi:MAG: hypothetical protein WBG46_10505 [Nonlabens sp.]